MNQPAWEGPYAEELSIALAAADAAGEHIRKGWGSERTVDAKGVGDFVTDVDRMADETVTAALTRAFPEDGIISEESPEPLPTKSGRTWIVDPLDGTTSFVCQMGPQFPSVLIALQEGRQTVLGVVHFPLAGETFFAVRGEGAWYGRSGSEWERLPKTEAEEGASLGSCWIDMNHFGDSSLESEWFASLRRNLRTKGGAFSVTTYAPYSGVAARIARGMGAPAAIVHDNHPEKVKQAVWDVAAPLIVLEEAGGVALAMTGQPYDPFSPQPFVMARSEAIARAVLERADS